MPIDPTGDWGGGESLRVLSSSCTELIAAGIVFAIDKIRTAVPCRVVGLDPSGDIPEYWGSRPVCRPTVQRACVPHLAGVQRDPKCGREVAREIVEQPIPLPLREPGSEGRLRALEASKPSASKCAYAKRSS